MHASVSRTRLRRHGPHRGRAPTLAFALVLTVALAGERRVAAAPPPGDGAEATAGPGRPRVHLEVRGDRPLTLYESVAPAGPGPTRRRAATLHPICNAPCDRVVDGRQGQSFVLGGPGLSRSVPFSILSSDTALTIHARPGRRALFVAGWVLASIGAAAVLAGAATLTAADDDRTLRRAGGFTFLAGVPFVAGGAVMIAFGRTRFRLGDR